MFFCQIKVTAQVVSINGGYISISNNTTISADTISNNTSTLSNDGTITLQSFLNTGTVQGNGTYNISKRFINSGTFTPAASTVNYNGSIAQSITQLSYNNLTISNSTANCTANGALTVSGALQVNASSVLDMSNYDLLGALTSVTNNGSIKTQSTSATPLPTGKTWGGTIEYNKTTGGQTIVAGTYNNLTNSNTSGTNTSTSDLTINGTLTMNTSSIMDVGTNTLSGSLTSITGAGTFKTQNTSATPIPSGKTWSGVVSYYSSSAQTIVPNNYNDLNAAGGNRTIDSSGVLGIAGLFTTGSGVYTVAGSTIDFNGNTAQTIPAFSFNNLKVSGGSTKTCSGNINLRNNLLFGDNTILALSSYDIKLQSDSTYTARVDIVPVTSSVTYGTGRFISDRYVIGRRKFRLMTSPVTTSPNATLTTGEEALSIWGNWQNQGNDVTANVGTIITGGTAADGFDQHTTKTSLFTYNSATRAFVDFTSANGKNTKYTPLKAGVPYFMFVYGDRTNYAGTAYPKKTILTSKGKIVTGDQTYTTASTLPLDGITDRYTMIGNPFASSIDWTTVTRTNLYDTYWGWDPNLNNTGGFVTVNSVGNITLISPYSGSVGLDQYIQSGQSFFVRTAAASPVLTIKETDKVDNYNPIAFRTNRVNEIPLIAVNLFDINNNKLLLDGTLAAFSQDFSNNIGKEDAAKIPVSAEGVAIKRNGELLSIDARKLPKNLDTIMLNMSRFTQPNYALQIFSKGLDTLGLEAFLYDNHLKTSTRLLLTDTNRLNLAFDETNAASSNENRFYILFKEPGYVIPVFSTIKATKVDDAVKVEWDISNDKKVNTYEVQRSVNGQPFNTIGIVTGRRSNFSQSYNWLDQSPVTGANSYKIHAIETDGRDFYSNTVTIIFDGNNNAGIKVFPNPVRNQLINLQLNNIEKGQYTMRLLSMSGKEVLNKGINHPGGSAGVTINISAKLPAGMYILQLANGSSNFTQKIILEN